MRPPLPSGTRTTVLRRHTLGLVELDVTKIQRSEYLFSTVSRFSELRLPALLLTLLLTSAPCCLNRLLSLKNTPWSYALTPPPIPLPAMAPTGALQKPSLTLVGREKVGKRSSKCDCFRVCLGLSHVLASMSASSHEMGVLTHS